jgi:hypothetical protein
MPGTYTVPTTAIYENSVTGARQRFKAGDTMTMELAVQYGMPGAALTVEPDTTGAALRADVDALEAEVAAIEPGVSLEEGSYVLRVASFDVLRTHTEATLAFTLPANAVPLFAYLRWEAGSDAGDSAEVKVGTFAVDNAFSDGSVADPTGNLKLHSGGAAAYGASVGGSPLDVYVIYTEAGTPSTTGGPFGLSMIYMELVG